MHDFKLFKISRLKINSTIRLKADGGYLGIGKCHSNCQIPKKKSKLHPLTQAEKKENKELSKKRICVEHVFAALKVFRILTAKYRNRRKRFGLRFNLIAGIYNHEIQLKITE